MSENKIVRGKVVGGHIMSHSLLPRLVDWSVIGLHFDGTAAYPERITAITPDGQFAGHPNKHVADIIIKVVIEQFQCQQFVEKPRPEGKRDGVSRFTTLFQVVYWISDSDYA